MRPCTHLGRTRAFKGETYLVTSGQVTYFLLTWTLRVHSDKAHYRWVVSHKFPIPDKRDLMGVLVGVLWKLPTCNFLNPKP